MIKEDENPQLTAMVNSHHFGFGALSLDRLSKEDNPTTRQ